MWIADLFSPAREQQFLVLLGEQTALLADAAGKLEQYARSNDRKLVEEISNIEVAADEVLQRTTTALRDAFITPLDRQDIYNLSETIDDMIDYLNNAASEIALFRVKITPAVCDMTASLRSAATEIETAVRCLKNDPAKAWQHGRAAQAAENTVEDRYRSALVELFAGNDVHEMFKLREIYRHLSNSADRAEAVGRLIGKIVVKTS